MPALWVTSHAGFFITAKLVSATPKFKA